MSKSYFVIAGALALVGLCRPAVAQDNENQNENDSEKVFHAYSRFSQCFPNNSWNFCADFGNSVPSFLPVPATPGES